MRPRDQSNRRSEVRFAFNTGAPLRWQAMACDDRGQDGWLKDLSESGLAMLVTRDHAPRAGQSIEVQYATHSELGVYHILRVDPVNEQVSLVACRRESESRPWDIGPGGGLTTHVDAPRDRDTAGVLA